MKCHEMFFNKKRGVKVGIAVIAYNRIDTLKKCIYSIEKNTLVPYSLVICDDGSEDGTIEWLQSNGYSVVGGVNRGIAWNKNRGLYWLLKNTSAEILMLIEDDCSVVENNWLDLWVPATEKYGHINLVHPQTSKALRDGFIPQEIVGGAGTADDPYACLRISGLCISSSRKALIEVGYLDTRFLGYGHEHSEWTTRFRRAGFGIKYETIDGVKVKANAMLADGLLSLDAASQSDKSTVKSNKEVFNVCKSDPESYRKPWRSEVDRVHFVEEIKGDNLKSKVFGFSKFNPEQARSIILSEPLCDTEREKLYVVNGLDHRTSVCKFLRREMVCIEDEFYKKLGFVSTSYNSIWEDINFDLALNYFVDVNISQDDSLCLDDFLENGTIRHLISTKQVDPHKIGIKGNVGDNYGPKVVQYLSGMGVSARNLNISDEVNVMLSVGSYIQHAKSRGLVWGTGTVAPLTYKQQVSLTKSLFIGVRGPRTRESILLKYGINPQVVGDPGLLVTYSHPSALKKSTKLGFVIHAADLPWFVKHYPNAYIIPNNITFEDYIERLTCCEFIVSSSLHGLIMAHSYGIPCAVIRIGSNIKGEDFKFIDYMQSIGCYSFKGRVDYENRTTVENEEWIDLVSNAYRPNLANLQRKLFSSFPF